MEAANTVERGSLIPMGSAAMLQDRPPPKTGHGPTPAEMEGAGRLFAHPSRRGRKQVSEADGKPGDLLVPLQLRTVRLGVQMTLLGLLAAAPFVISGSATPQARSYVALVAATAVAAALAAFVPRKGTGWGLRTQYAWSAVNVVLITLGIWVTGGVHSYLFYLYALTTLFIAVSFSPAVQVAFLAFTFGCYISVLGLTGWGGQGANVLLSLASLAILATLASFVSRELKKQISAHAAARAESDRRWALLATVAAAARSMSTVDSQTVLEAVVDSIVALGFQTARIYLDDNETKTHSVVLPHGLPEHSRKAVYSLPSVLRESVLDRRETVSLSDADAASKPILEELGLRSVVATPILRGEKAVAMLLVGSNDEQGPSALDVEVFRLLAAQANLALENARGFEDQRRAVARMSELDKLKSDFLSNVSHELRTPLTVITGMGLTLEQQWADLHEELRRELLGRLNANAKSLDGIITKLLDFSRLEAGRLEVRASEVPLEELLRAVVARLDFLFAHHILTVEIESDLVVRADPVLLDRVVENLLSNAAKYTPSGSQVLLSCRRGGPDTVVVTVRDNGKGITKDELQHLGERFFRGGDPNTRTTRGTGLGLALTIEILRLHGTKLEVRSAVGRGSSFSFTLQLVGPKPQADEGEAPVYEPVARRSEDPSAEDGSLPASRGLAYETVVSEPFEQILSEARTGIDWAGHALYRKFNPTLVQYLKAQDPEGADQVASQVWLNVATGLSKFQGGEAEFRKWILEIARRRLLEIRREAGAEGEPEQAPASSVAS